MNPMVPRIDAIDLKTGQPAVEGKTNKTSTASRAHGPKVTRSRTPPNYAWRPRDFYRVCFPGFSYSYSGNPIPPFGTLLVTGDS
jgi:hypothetical protein